MLYSEILYAVQWQRSSVQQRGNIRKAPLSTLGVCIVQGKGLT